MYSSLPMIFPQSCAFPQFRDSLAKNKKGILKLGLVASLCVNVGFWPIPPQMFQIFFHFKQ